MADEKFEIMDVEVSAEGNSSPHSSSSVPVSVTSLFRSC